MKLLTRIVFIGAEVYREKMRTALHFKRQTLTTKQFLAILHVVKFS